MDKPEYNFAGDDDQRKEKSSGAILGALAKAQKEFNDWQANCQTIDDIYSQKLGPSPLMPLTDDAPWTDTRLDLFWASFEVLKPATYARTPVPAVGSTFKDNKQLYNVTGELLERATIQVFRQNHLGDSMCHVRDDLLFAGRGVLWVIYHGGEVSVEHVDRTDYLHEPARYWSEVGWCAKRSWLTYDESVKRFGKDKAERLAYATKKDQGRNGQGEIETSAPKAPVWEVWHKADGRVYWVSEGCDIILDESKPPVDLSGFFPCPRPAYGTLARRSLVPVPDWNRYAIHFSKISEMTGRIYLLLDMVRMKGLIPGGGDVGDALELIMKSNDDSIIVPVPAAAMLGAGDTLVHWLPLEQVAGTIGTLIEARSQLIQDFYELSGISDIMRGATEAEETLGAQQLKSHYGSVRVEEKVRELQRIAADATRISAEILAEKFGKDKLLDMSGMEIPTRADLQKQVKELEAAAQAELAQVAQQAQQELSQPNAQAQFQQEGAAEAAQQQFQQAQQQVIAKYAGQLEQLQGTVPIEDVMALLRDDKARSFTFDIETDSTILNDEMGEKAQRNEFMQQFMSSSQAMMGLMAMGDAGAELAGEMLRFVLAPYRAGRALDGAIDAFIEAAPELAKAAQAQAGSGDEGLAEANKMLAEAEQTKAQAATLTAQARAQQAEADNQRKMAEMQIKMANDAQKAEQENAKLRMQLQQQADDSAKQAAEIDKLRAQTLEIMNNIGIARDENARAAFQSVADVQMRASDQAMQHERNERADFESDRSADMGERQQTFSENQAMAGDDD